MYNTIAKYDTFVRELEKYTNEQCYLEDYNRVKDSAINSIKCSEGYERFNSEDMNKYGVKVEKIWNEAKSKEAFFYNITIEYPESYTDLCIMAGGCSRLVLTTKSGEQIYTNTSNSFLEHDDLYSKTDKAYCHGMRIQ